MSSAADTAAGAAVAGTGRGDGPRRRWGYLFERERVLGPVMLLPAVLYLIFVVGYPLLLAFFYAFSDVTVGSNRFDFVGFQTFITAIHDPVFLKAIEHSFLITGISQALVIVLCTVLAFVLAADFHGKWFLRFLVLMPWTTPVALGAIIWLWMLDSIFTPFDWFASKLGVIPDGGHLVLLGHAGTAVGSVIAVQTWRMLPLATVIVLAGLSSIPQDIEEQAQVDGAGFWRRLFSIQLPLLAPVIMVAILFGVVFTFTDMAVIFILTGGGPGNATQVLPSWAFYKGINGGNLSVGAADAMFMFPVLLGITAIVLRMASRIGGE
ncbi:MAG TPA: sugar ABC transporter permease [Nocardioidaceae bacterium]|nr:sugar ABC transporter permease [Nocardioidaceae bacterium]